MDSFRQGWFTEIGVLNGNSVTKSIKAEKVLHRERSKYQDILVFDRWVIALSALRPTIAVSTARCTADVSCSTTRFSAPRRTSLRTKSKY